MTKAKGEGAATPSYTVGAISKLLLISERRVYQLVNDGVIPKTQRGRFELESAVHGYIRFLQERSVGRPSGPEDYQVEKARLVKNQADKAEIEVQTLSGELVSSENVSKHWYQMVTDCKTRLLSIPSKAAPIVASETNAGAVQEIIEELVREALEELANYENSGRETDIDEGDEGVDATPKAKRK